MTGLLLVSFVAGVLTVAAPCVLPLLPVIVGGSIVRTSADTAVAERQWFRPITIAAGLVVSIILFTLLLQATTALLGVPRIVWQVLSGGILVLFGLTMIFPAVWERLMTATGLQRRANTALDASYRRGGLGGDLLLGAALGPVFASCSPTYALIVAAVLPAEFAVGLLYLLLYSIGLAATLLLVAFLGQAFARRLGWLNRPTAKRVVGVILIVVGIAIIVGLDKLLQAWILEQGWYDPIADFEEGLTG
ncbi:MAG: cytochrome c biogenesis CcdA family protein [Microbacteriaceae bacterium]